MVKEIPTDISKFQNVKCYLNAHLLKKKKTEIESFRKHVTNSCNSPYTEAFFYSFLLLHDCVLSVTEHSLLNLAECCLGVRNIVEDST